jgi:hypothetical protein
MQFFLSKREEKCREKLLPFQQNVRMGVMQFFLLKRDENSLRKLLPFQQNGHIGVMRRARAKEMAARDVIRQTNYPMLIKIVPSILIWYKIKKIPWGK